jgi:hypothetical protein
MAKILYPPGIGLKCKPMKMKVGLGTVVEEMLMKG